MENHVFLNRYRLSLGRNGLPVELHRAPNGITYRGHQIDSGREVAIELVPWTPPNPAASERMTSAATAAKQINHINIPTLHDFGIEHEQLVFVSDYFEGPTAEAWVAARGSLPVGAVLRIALQVVGALGAASFHRLQHSAINPANIIFVPGQTAEGDWPAIKVLRWLAPDVVAAEGGNDRADAAARFASPEQLHGGEVDFASAIFSLGCTMWFLLTGAPPAAPGAKGVRVGVEKLRGVPKIVRHLLGRMLRVNPAERPQDPVVLQAYLQTCLARVERRETMSKRLGAPLLARAPANALRTVRNWPTKPLALAALLLLCATLAAVALPRFLRSRTNAHAAVAAEKVNLPAATPISLVRSDRRETSPNELITAPTTTAPELVAATPPPSPAETVVSVTQTESPVLASNEAAERPVIIAPDEVSQPAGKTESEPRLAAEKSAPPMPELAPPAEGPGEMSAAAPGEAAPTTTAPELVAVTPQPSAAETVAPRAPTESPVLASSNAAEAPVAVPPEEVPQPAGNTESDARLAAGQDAPPTPSPTPAEAREKREVAARTSSRKKSKTEHVASQRKSHPRSHRKVRLAHAEVRRAGKIPTLHVGRSRAELVGTTDDGRWILSVANSGQRIIVPPPPGYSR